MNEDPHSNGQATEKAQRSDEDAASHHSEAKRPARTPLLRPQWRYVEKAALEDFNSDDWALMNAQRADYRAERQAEEVLRMLTGQAQEPSFGYVVNNYLHCLQSATLALRDGLDEETVVVSLLHDIGFNACPESHAEFAAALLGPWTSERNHWMLLHHAVFQQFHIRGFPGLECDERDRWRGHPHFAWTAEWVEKYDQNATWDGIETLPIEAFKPLVRRFFAKPARPLPIA